MTGTETSFAPFFMTQDPIDGIAHLIQVALTPVFMLSGVASLLTLCNTRLARVSDHMEDVTHRIDSDEGTDAQTHARLVRHQIRLRRRIFVLDCSIVLGGIGGASTCGAALALFLGSLHDSQTISWLIFLFGAALSCTVGALAVFLVDTGLAWHGLRRDGVLPRPSPASSNK